MARQGTRTSHPGILRIDSNTFVVRVTTRHPTTKKRLEKEETIAGKLDDARRRQLELLDELTQKRTQTTTKPSTKPTTNVPPRQRAQPAMTLGDFARLWLGHLVDKNVARPAYVSTRVAYLEGLILPKLEAVRVDAVDEWVLEQWSVWLAGRRKADGNP
ncbi:MAG: hypothetical protein FJ137_10485 [Deltaproteobacteria bacterium]|nr:hypothetical protein [Deltaproteobacteria bacterium]